MADPRFSLLNPYGPHFKTKYALKDQQKENEILNIQKEVNRTQILGIVSSIPFFLFSGHKKDLRWTIPAFILIGGSKYYQVVNFKKQMQEKGVKDYWMKSKKFNFELNNAERQVNKYLKEKKPEI